jgi:hypothetical protein
MEACISFTHCNSKEASKRFCCSERTVGLYLALLLDFNSSLATALGIIVL